MAQVSYGTITITDTTDIKTFIRYAKKVGSGMTQSDFQLEPTTDTHYIAVLSTTESTAPAWNSSDWKWNEFIGTDGISVIGVDEIYYLKTNTIAVNSPTDGNDISQTSDQVINQWTKSVPTYVIGGEYWTCIQTHLSGSPTWVYSVATLNQALTNMNYNAYLANSLAQSANENAQGSLSIAQDIHQHFWENATDYVIPNSNPSFTLPAGAYITDTLISTFKGDNGPTGGYMLTRSDGLWIGSGKYRLAALTGSALGFYEPGTTLLNSNDETYLDAKLDANGLILKKGGITVSDAGQPGFIYLSTEDYPLKDEANNIEGLTINEWTPSVTGTREGQLSNDPAWRQVIGTNFGVDSEGNIYAAGGQIGGWHIGIDANRSLYYENQVPGATTTNLVISSGSEVNTNSIAGSGTNENWFLSAGQKFGVTTDGTLYAIDAEINGKITVNRDSNVYTKTEANEAFDAFGTVAKYITQIDEHGINIHPDEIVVDNLYIETADAVCDIDKTYYYIDNNEYIKFHGSTFENGVTYYERLVNYSMQLDGHGLEFLQNNFSTAYYGDKVRIGDKNGFHILMTDQRLSFYDGNNEVAYISDDQLYITKSVVLQQMEVGTPLNSNNNFGQWSWKVRQNSNGQNNLQLKWLG